MTASAIDWPALRRAYEESDASLRDLSARFGVDRSVLTRRARRDEWVRPEGVPVPGPPGRRAPPTTAALVRALERTTARLVVGMEARLERAGEAVEEKDLRALGALAGTLAKVIALAAAERPERDRDPDGPSDRRHHASEGGSDDGGREGSRPAGPGGAGGGGAAGAGGGGTGGGRPLDFDDPAILLALSHRLERLAAERAGGLAAAAEPDREGELGAILADVRAGRPTGPAR